MAHTVEGGLLLNALAGIHPCGGDEIRSIGRCAIRRIVVVNRRLAIVRVVDLRKPVERVVVNIGGCLRILIRCGTQLPLGVVPAEIPRIAKRICDQRQLRGGLAIRRGCAAATAVAVGVGIGCLVIRPDHVLARTVRVPARVPHGLKIPCVEVGVG